MTYEAPAVEERAEIGGALVGLPAPSDGGQLSLVWRRPEDEQQEDSP